MKIRTLTQASGWKAWYINAGDLVLTGCPVVAWAVLSGEDGDTDRVVGMVMDEELCELVPLEDLAQEFLCLSREETGIPTGTADAYLKSKDLARGKQPWTVYGGDL